MIIEEDAIENIEVVVNLDESEGDISEREKVETFIKSTCECSLGPGKTPCSNHFPKEYIINSRLDCLDLEKEQLDFLVIGLLRSHHRKSDFINVYNHGKAPSKKVNTVDNTKASYFVDDVPVCRKTFAFLHTIGHNKLDSLRKHYISHGITERQHSLKRKQSNNPKTLPVEKVKDIKDFIYNIAINKSIPLPGRLPNCGDLKVMKLPTEFTKASIYREYCASMKKKDENPVSYTSFERIWRKYLPYVCTMKPGKLRQFLCLIIQSAENHNHL